jgi:hypothetical protein
MQQRLLLLLHILAALSVLLLPIVVWVQGIGILLLFIHYRYSPRYMFVCHRLVWQAGNHWLLTQQQHTETASLLPGSVLLPWLIILLFKMESGKNRVVAVWPDAVHPQGFRRLKVRLKIEQGSLFAPSA